MAISASDGKRAAGNEAAAGMMDCKKALVECDGDMEKAAELFAGKGPGNSC